METFRTFVAVALPPKLRGELGHLIADHASDGDGVKWVPPEILHMTLKFLGEVDNVDAAAVCDIAADACEDIAPFDVSLVRTGALPSPQRGRTLTMSIEDPGGHLRRIVSRMEDGYAAMGFRRETRDYVPHIALGRARGGSRRINGEVLERWLDPDNAGYGDLTIDRLEVVASFLDKTGPTYQTLQTIEL